MSDQKISELTNITGANLADADEFVVVDVSADQTKAVTRAEFFKDTPDITATGTVTADGLTVDGELKIERVGSDNSGIYWDRNGTQDAAIRIADNEHMNIDNNFSRPFNFRTGAVGSEVQRMQITQGGDISFYEDTGVTPKFFWDASAESLGIGNAAPAHPLDFATSASGHVIRVGDDNVASYMSFSNPRGFVGFDGVSMRIQSGLTKDLVFATGDSVFGQAASEAMRIDSSGNVGIANISPATALDVTGTVTADGLTVDNGVVRIRHTSDPASTIEGLQLTASASGAGRFLPAITWGYGTSSPDFSLVEASRGSGIGGRLHFKTANASGTMEERLLIDEDGNVGIANISPATALDVTGTVTATSYAGNGANLTGVLRKGPDIGASVDLDTYDTDGYYHQNSNSNAISGTNYPASLAGMLTVTSDGSMVYQHYQTYNGSGAYQRTKYNATWHAWDKILDSGNLTTTGTVTATSYTEAVFVITGTTPALDPVNGSIQTWTLTAASTPTSSLSSGESMTLMIEDGTAYSITWPTMTWVNNGGAAPTLATSGKTVVALWNVAGNLYGSFVGNGS